MERTGVLVVPSMGLKAALVSLKGPQQELLRHGPFHMRVPPGIQTLFYS